MEVIGLLSVLLALVVLAIGSHMFGADSRPGIEWRQVNWW
jgi:hypothetical protein